MKAAILLALLLAAGAAMAKGKGSSAGGPPANRTGADNSTVVHGSGGRAGYDVRRPPPLAPARKVTERDCSKPFDLAEGNLRCK